MATYLTAESRTGYDRRYEDKVFPLGTRCIEMVDYIGAGGPRDENGEMLRDGGPGQSFGVAYCRSESFYRCFARAKFCGPCLIDIGEFPAEAYDAAGYPITDTRINMAAAFRDSDLQIAPHGCSRELVSNLNSTFENCVQLRHWLPQEMAAQGLAMVTDRTAPRILQSNGMAHTAFWLELAPQTMKRMLANCVSFEGNGLNSISWRNLKADDSASGWAEGCRFAPYVLDGIIATIHHEFFTLKRVRTPLLNVNLGAGRVVGETATMARQLKDAGIDLVGFDIGLDV